MAPKRTCLAGTILVALGVLGCSLQGLAVRGAETPPKLSFREGSSAVFEGSEIEFRLDLSAGAPIAGTLVWRHSANNRTLSAGDGAIPSDQPLVLKLNAPHVKDGVALATQLAVTLVDDQGKPQATCERSLWVLPRDPFAQRKAWLKELHLWLFDPEGHTAETLEASQIGVTRVTTLAALDRIDGGIAIIGEGVDLVRFRALGDSLRTLAGQGISVLCLAPQQGELPNPASGAVAPIAMRFERERMVAELDKRLSAAAWPLDAETVPQHFTLMTGRHDVVLRVARQPDGWPWIEATYPQETKLVLCGFPLIKTWDRDPTARYLLARILETLDRSKKPPPE